MKQKFQKKLFKLQNEIDNLDRSNHFLKLDVNTLTYEKDQLKKKNQDLEKINKNLTYRIKEYEMIKIDKKMITIIYITIIIILLIFGKILH